MRCPICDGDGYFYEDFEEGTVTKDACPACKHTGKVNIFKRIYLWYVCGI